MSAVNLFLQFPVSNPIEILWSLSNEPFQSEEGLQNIIANKISEIDSLYIENYTGFYDSENLNNFLEHFHTLEDLYPLQPTQLLLDTIKDWEDWRSNPVQKNDANIQLFNFPIQNHTISEIAQRKLKQGGDKFALLNNSALSFQTEFITVNISNRPNIEIPNLKNTQELQLWFSTNRIPHRNFHVIEKHPIKDLPPRMWHGKFASYLHCSELKATELLRTAIGETKYELFANDKDQNEYIVYKYENVENQNLYHGYHVPKDSDEVPEGIKRKLEIE